MTKELTEKCSDCGVVLEKFDGPTHRYIGASASCWALFSALNNAGDPPLAPAPTNGLIVDAYAAQHPGQPSPQAIQSVAVHLIALYAVLERGLSMDRAVWVRQKPLEGGGKSKHELFSWLAPPALTAITIADIVARPTPEERTAMVQQYVESVWKAWAVPHGETIEEWYDKYIYGQ